MQSQRKKQLILPGMRKGVGMEGDTDKEVWRIEGEFSEGVSRGGWGILVFQLKIKD